MFGSSVCNTLIFNDYKISIRHDGEIVRKAER